MKSDTLAMDTDLLLSVLSFAEPYQDETHAKQIRRHWRKVARKSKINIQTYDNTHAQEVIIIRKSAMPHDEYLRSAQRIIAGDKLSRYINEHTNNDKT